MNEVQQDRERRRYSAGASLGAGVSVPEAQQWAAHFAAASYGDALPAAALALLLQREVPGHVQAREPFFCICMIWLTLLRRWNTRRNLGSLDPSYILTNYSSLFFLFAQRKILQLVLQFCMINKPYIIQYSHNLHLAYILLVDLRGSGQGDLPASSGLR